jgi:hypothetical protein
VDHLVDAAAQRVDGAEQPVPLGGGQALHLEPERGQGGAQPVGEVGGAFPLGGEQLADPPGQLVHHALALLGRVLSRVDPVGGAHLGRRRLRRSGRRRAGLRRLGSDDSGSDDSGGGDSGGDDNSGSGSDHSGDDD